MADVWWDCTRSRILAEDDGFLAFEGLGEEVLLEWATACGRRHGRGWVMRVDARCKRGRAAVGFGAFGMQSTGRETGEGRKMSGMSRENGCEMSEWVLELDACLALTVTFET